MSERENATSTDAELRALDVEVAESVMGWQRWTCSDDDFQQSTLFRPEANPDAWRRCGTDVTLAKHAATMVPRYSTDIAAAWRVVEKMFEHHARVSMVTGLDGVRVCFFDVRWAGAKDSEEGRHPYSVGEAAERTAPLAICRAALRALGVVR